MILVVFSQPEGEGLHFTGLQAISVKAYEQTPGQWRYAVISRDGAEVTLRKSQILSMEVMH